MTLRTHIVCAVCGKPQTARRKLVTIPQFLSGTSLELPGGLNLPTYCLNRRCVVRGVFELAMVRLKEWQGRA